MQNVQVIETEAPHEFYVNLLENLYDGVYFIDPDRRITYWNTGAERLTGHRRDQVVGKSCTDDMLLHIDADAADIRSATCPAIETLEDGKVREADAYLRHREGHMVPVRLRVAPIPDADGRRVGVIVVLADRSEIEDIQARFGQARQQALTDPLTGLFSRRYLELRLQSRLDELKRYGWKFGIIFATIDAFDEIEEVHPRDRVEELIVLAGQTFAATFRSFDTIGRWSNHEFLAVVPILKDSDLYAIGERVRGLVEEAYVEKSDRLVGVTISVGAAAMDPRDTIEEMVERAGLHADVSAEGGGNRVSF